MIDKTRLKLAGKQKGYFTVLQVIRHTLYRIQNFSFLHKTVPFSK